METNKQSRGSEWRKWDLHFHTQTSYDYKDKSITNEKIIEVLEQQNISVVAITDHHVIDVDRIIELQKIGKEKNITVLPGIEFLSDARGNEPIHFIAIFSENSNIRHIWKQIESKTDINKIEGENKKHNEVYCHLFDTIKLIKELGGIITIHAGEKTNGIENITHSLPHGIAQKEDIAKVINVFEMGKESDCKGYINTVIPYLIKKIDKHIPMIICSDNHKITEYVIKQNLWIKADPTFEGLKQIIFEPTERVKIQKEEPDSHKLDHQIIEQVSFSSSIQYFWKNKTEKNEFSVKTIDELNRNIKDAISSGILNDDEINKNESFLRSTVEDRFKEDYLKDIILVSEGKKYCYSKFQKFTPNPIFFNKNLNVIIGGKSSGKSILLYNIARTLLNTNELGKIFNEEGKENEFNFREQKDANQTPDSQFNFEVRTKIPDIVQTRFDYNGNSILPEVIYIPQNYLIKLAEPEYYKKGEPLNKIIRRLIIEKEFYKRQYDDVFIANVKAKDDIRKGLIKRYFEIKVDINNLNNELGTKGNKADIEKIINHNSDKIVELKKETGLLEGEIENYKEKQNQLEQLNKKENKIKKDLITVLEFNRRALTFLKDIKEQKDSVLSNIENDEIKTDFQNKYIELENFIKSIEQYINSYQVELANENEQQYNFKEANLFKTLLENINQEKLKIEKELEPYRRNADVEKNIKYLVDSSNIQQNNLNAIIEIEEKIKNKKIELRNKKNDIFSLYINTFREYQNIIEKLKPRVKALELDGLKITGKIKFNFPKLRKEMWEISHGSSKSYNKWDILNDTLTRNSDYSTKQFINNIKGIFEDIEEGKYVLLSSPTKEHAINVLLYDHFYDYWEVEYKGDKIGRMSTGKASFVILMIIIGLSESQAPILIDQPEDNLDNRSIMEDLVTYLKNKKKERQIILVTHNANIVVNADAENIIVANQRGQSNNDWDSDCPYQFDYTNGAIENTFPKIDKEKDLLKSMGIREHIAEIVEGGKDAFKKREEKYDFK